MRDAENVVLEDLKRILAEQAAARYRDQDILSRLARMNRSLDRITRDNSSNYSDLVKSRNAVGRLWERVAKIERRLGLA